jgi:hypothetical protein
MVEPGDIWIKTLGMGRPGQEMPDHWEDVGNGLFHRAATFGSRPGMRTGDLIVLHAALWGVEFAAGEVVSMPYMGREPGEHNWPWMVNIKLTHWVEWLHDGVPLEHLNTGQRDLRVSIRRRSHIRLTRSEYDNAIAALIRAGAKTA